MIVKHLFIHKDKNDDIFVYYFILSNICIILYNLSIIKYFVIQNLNYGVLK
jgi:hypothetical protein